MSTPTLIQRVLRKGFRPFYPLYYRLLWSRMFPGSAGLERLVRSYESLSSRGDAPQSTELWDKQYNQGAWDLLQDPEEVPRYQLLVSLWKEHCRPGSILDVGCGDAVLRQFLPIEGGRYVGLDLSPAAIERGRSRILEKDALLAANAESWEIDASYETIILNECVYYFEDPLVTVERYWASRTEGGSLIVSMFGTPRSRAIRQQLIRRWPLVHQEELATERGTWWMGVFQ